MSIMASIDILYVLFLLIWLHCATGRNVLLSCNFGTEKNETYCDMVQDMSDNFDWDLTSSSEKSNTGPTMDHTGNTGGRGRFLWANSAARVNGQMATISTAPINLTDGEGWLTFWYHLFGDGKLEICVCQGGGPVTLNGDQGNRWHEQNMTVSCGDNPSQITFTSIRNSEMSDVGIDDLYVYDHPLTVTDTSVTTRVSAATMNEHTTKSYNSVTTMTTLDESTTITTAEGVGSSTSISPLPRKGKNLALPVSLSVFAAFFVAALIMIVCFIMKRRQQPEKPIAQESVHRYDNHAYSTEIDEVRDNTTDTRRNTNGTFDSSTWRSEFSTMNGTGGNGTGRNGTLSESQPPNLSSQAPDPGSRHYFVLNPGRASMLVEGGEGEARNQYDPVALYDNKPERYTYIENEGSSTAMETGDAAGEVGMGANGYDPVTIKDDITGGYQFLDGTGTTMANGATDYTELRCPYEPVAVREKPSKTKKAKASERKTPIPAARKNVPPQPKDRMVDNVLYKPMNGEQMVDNVLYNPIQEGK